MSDERRIHADLRVEQRAGEKGKKLVGYAAVFNTPANIGGVFVEEVKPGAFRSAIKDDDIRALIDHDKGRVLGRNKSGTLRLMEDDIGLRFEIDPPDTQAARDLMHLIERGDVTGASFGFRARVDEWDYDAKPAKRSLVDVALHDVSIVTYPAYPEAGVALRSLASGRAAALREKMQAGIAARSKR